MIRVRKLLDSLNSVERKDLKKLLPRPAELRCPPEPDSKYPSGLMSVLPEPYSMAGLITEALVALPPIAITVDRLIQEANALHPLTDAAAAKVRKSKTTEPFLESIRATRKLLNRAAFGRGPLRHEEEVGHGPVRGHPDYRNNTQIFEVKMTGQLTKNWPDFLYQVFAYAALDASVTDIYLVLPLQKLLWHYDTSTWFGKPYADFLEAAATRNQANYGPAIALIEGHRIGMHMSKLKTLADTVSALPTDRPSQIFLSGPQSSKIHVDADDEAAAAAIIMERGLRLFIHSAYLINLCALTDDGFHSSLLIKTLQIAVAIGALGVVVHVGKATTQEGPTALATMRMNLIACMEAATPTCPILLETPAGQGTEVLTERAAFIDFVASIGDPRLRICVDTCHVFACGHDPLQYLQVATPMTTLVHFNDSATPCGSCLDRHAFVGTGHIGIAAMTEIAEHCTGHDTPMVIE
jgi:deoxyribonuclease-4